MDLKFDNKVEVKDMVQLLDWKSNSEDLELYLNDINKKMESKIGYKVFEEEMRK